MASKFNIGDEVVIVRLNKRTPKYIRDAVRIGRARTVVAVSYDKTEQHNHYFLGDNRLSESISGYPFRAEELRFKGNKAGRPSKIRRAYRQGMVYDTYDGGKPRRF